MRQPFLQISLLIYYYKVGQLHFITKWGNICYIVGPSLLLSGRLLQEGQYIANK